MLPLVEAWFIGTRASPVENVFCQDPYTIAVVEPMTTDWRTTAYPPNRELTKETPKVKPFPTATRNRFGKQK